MTTLDDTNIGTQQSASSTATEDLKSTARNASTTVKQQVNEKRSSAAEGIESLAHAARVAASDLRQHDQDALSHYVAEMATSVTSLAEGLRKKSVDELIHDAKNIARNNPTLFIAGSIAIGLGIARFAKATQRRSESKTDASDYSTTSGRINTEDSSEDNEDDIPTLHTGFSTQVERGQQDSRSSSLKQPGGNGADTMGGTRYE